MFKAAKLQNKNVEYIKADVKEIEIEETDLLFIDTWHCYDQLKAELRIHSSKAKKYIAFHDTHSYGMKDEGTNTGLGLLPAIIEFMVENPKWKFKIYKTKTDVC